MLECRYSIGLSVSWFGVGFRGYVVYYLEECINGSASCYFVKNNSIQNNIVGVDYRAM